MTVRDREALVEEFHEVWENMQAILKRVDLWLHAFDRGLNDDAKRLIAQTLAFQGLSPDDKGLPVSGGPAMVKADVLAFLEAYAVSYTKDADDDEVKFNNDLEWKAQILESGMLAWAGLSWPEIEEYWNIHDDNPRRVSELDLTMLLGLADMDAFMKPRPNWSWTPEKVIAESKDRRLVIAENLGRNLGRPPQYAWR